MRLEAKTLVHFALQVAFFFEYLYILIIMSNWGIYMGTDIQLPVEPNSNEESISKKSSVYELSIDQNFHEDAYGDIQDMVSASASPKIGANVQKYHPHKGIIFIIVN